MARPREKRLWREWIGPRVRVRNRVRSGFLLLRGGWLQILQTAVAACAAWFLEALIGGSTVDLIGSTGMDRSSALQALEEATGRAS